MFPAMAIHSQNHMDILIFFPAPFQCSVDVSTSRYSHRQFMLNIVIVVHVIRSREPRDPCNLCRPSFNAQREICIPGYSKKDRASISHHIVILHHTILSLIRMRIILIKENSILNFIPNICYHIAFFSEYPV